MESKAKVFYTNRSQAVRLPKEFQFSVKEVYIHREGEKLVLSPRPLNWDKYLMEGPIAPSDFMATVRDLPLQKRTSS
jgi:antitoxin VapB